MLNLIYFFSSRYKYNSTSLQRTMDFYKKSYEINSKFHNIILYTEEESLELFKDIFKNIKFVDTSDVIFTDDMRMKVLSLCKNTDIICDNDVFLKRELVIDNNYDVMYDTMLETKYTIHKKFYEYYSNISKILYDEGISEIVPYYKANIHRIPNIGLCWFADTQNKKDFLRIYNEQKRWIIEKGIYYKYEMQKDFKNDGTFSQYLLALFARERKLKITSFNSTSEYNHFSGGQKYAENFIKRFDKKMI